MATGNVVTPLDSFFITLAPLGPSDPTNGGIPSLSFSPT